MKGYFCYFVVVHMPPQVADQGMKGITFLRDAIMTECDTYDWQCKQTGG